MLMKWFGVLCKLVVVGLVSCSGVVAMAETYRCTKGGQTVISDVPCAPGAGRVDAQSDAVSREQRRQAELVDTKNRRQLSEIEYRNARERNYQGGVYVLEPTPAATSSNTTRRGRAY